LEKLQEQNSY